MKYKDLANLNKSELLEQEKKIKEQLHKLNYQRYAGRVEQPHLFSLHKKDIARIKTVLRQGKSKS